MASLRPAVVLISVAAIVWPQVALAWRNDWLAHIASAIQESNQHVERVFELEQQGLFKSCAEDSDAVTFTVARMAVGAALLRDLWFAAWNRSR